MPSVVSARPSCAVPTSEALPPLSLDELMDLARAGAARQGVRCEEAENGEAEGGVLPARLLDKVGRGHVSCRFT